MEPLVRASLVVRTLLRRGHGLALACALGAYVVEGGATAEPGVAQGAALATWLFLLAVRIPRKLRESGDAGVVLDFEIGALLAVAAEAGLLRLDGGLGGHLSPAVYVLVALVAAFSRPIAGVLVVAWVVALEAGIRVVTLHETDLGGFITHACFVGAFAVLNLVLLRAEVVRIRATARARV